MIILKTDQVSLCGNGSIIYKQLSQTEEPRIFLRWLQIRARIKNKTLYTNIFI